MKKTGRWLGLGFLIPVVLAGGLAVGAAAHGGDDDDDRGRDNDDRYAIGLWGDLPYSTIQATIGIPNMIADMNASGSRSPRSTATSRLVRTPPCNDASTQARSHPRHARKRRRSLRRATTTGPIAIAVERRLQLARAPRPRTTLFFSTPFTPASTACASKCRPTCPASA